MLRFVEIGMKLKFLQELYRVDVMISISDNSNTTGCKYAIIYTFSYLRIVDIFS